MLGNDIEMSLIFGQALGPLVWGWALNHFDLGAQLAPGEKKISLYPCKDRTQITLAFNTDVPRTPPPPNYNQPQIQYLRDYILQILHRGSMISGHWFTVSMYSTLQWCHIRSINRLKLCRQDMLELLRGTVSSRRSFIQQQHSFISTVGRSITFAYRIVASH